MMLMDVLVGLLLLIFVNGVVGEHRIKLEKGYNLQERPASEKEGEPLEIRLPTFILTERGKYFCIQTICVLCVIDCIYPSIIWARST